MEKYEYLAKDVDNVLCQHLLADEKTECREYAIKLLFADKKQSINLCHKHLRIFLKKHSVLLLTNKSLANVPIDSSDITPYICKTQNTEKRIKHEQQKLTYTFDL